MSNLPLGAIGQKTFNWIKDNLEEGKTILELGSGYGTKELIKYWNVYSVEENHNWATVMSCHNNYIYAPLKDNWYDLDELKQWLPKEYDLIIIDGPKGSWGNSIRTGFYKNKDLFNLDSMMLFDDVQRPDEHKQMEMLSEELGRPFEEWDDTPQEAKDKGDQISFGVIK